MHHSRAEIDFDLGIDNDLDIDLKYKLYNTIKYIV